jgi:hypothetical protein
VVHGATDLVHARAEDLDGQFALVQSGPDGAVVATDPFGMHTLFAAERDGKTYVSTSVLALVRHLKLRADRFGTYFFVRAGYHFGSRTSWEGAERLEPAARIRFGDAGPERDLYWRPSTDALGSDPSFDAAVERVAAAAMDTFSSYFGDGFATWSDLTGGFDSRLVNLLLREVGVDVSADTRGQPHYDEVRLAAEIARAAGWSWRNLDLPQDWAERLQELVPTAVAWGDGNLDAVELARVFWAHAELAAGPPSLISGGGGEHFRGFAWRQEFLAAGRSRRVNMDNWLDMRLLHPLDTSLFADDVAGDIREDARRRMEAWVEPYSGELNTTQLDVMYAYKMTGHFGAFHSSDGGAIPSQLPFYFKPVFTAAFTTSHRHRDHHRLMRHMIERLDPVVARIRTTTGGPATRWRPTNLHRFAPYYAQIGRKAIGKLSQRVIGKRLLAEPVLINPVIVAGRLELLRRLDLRPETMLSGSLYREDALTAFLDRARRPEFGDASLLGRIVTVELALRATGSALG